MTSDDKVQVVGANIQEKATVIWNVADVLRGPFKPHEYGLVILPMTVIKRFHDCLLPTHDKVREVFEKNQRAAAILPRLLCNASGYQFYNTSKFTFATLLADADNIEANFRDYLAGFSENVQDILAKFEFENVIKRMVEANALYLVIKEFASYKGYLGPDKISAVDCGYIFEDLVRRFSESFGEEAGAHFTSRDVIYLMTDLLLTDADLAKGSLTVYDMTMGTSQMLSCMEERIHDLNSEVEVTTFGQEFNPSTYGIAKADMMIRGGDPNNMRFGDTLSEDRFRGFTFDYCISNPPFGIDWKREQKAVEAECNLGEAGRFAPGLPSISDGQQLFLLNGLAKLSPGGRLAIIQNGSPLFSGDAESGPSEIRRYLLENDWLDAIVQLSTDQFMNTGITTYIWLLAKNKPAQRAGKVQLIDASHCYEPRRKSIGTKRNDITAHCRHMIARAYGEFLDGEIYGEKDGVYCESKIFATEDFGYRKITVEQPFQRNFCASEERLQGLDSVKCYSSLAEEDKAKVLAGLRAIGDELYKNRNKFMKVMEENLPPDVKLTPANRKAIMLKLSEVDKTADKYRKKDGWEPDSELRDYEQVPLKEDIHTYFEREVLPFVPDAWIDEQATKVGYEIPMTRYFYEYQAPEPVEDIVARIRAEEQEISAALENLFAQEDK